MILRADDTGVTFRVDGELHQSPGSPMVILSSGAPLDSSRGCSIASPVQQSPKYENASFRRSNGATLRSPFA
jgi:hypothetical protein